MKQAKFRTAAWSIPLQAIGPTFVANLGNQAVVVLSQVAVIPLLVGQWGLRGYGIWLLLTAIPNYLTVSDFGFTTAAKSDMALRAARTDVAGAQVTGSSVAALLAVAIAAVAVVYLAIVYSIDWARALHLDDLGTREARQVLSFGLLQLASYQAFLLAASTLRAAGAPAAEVWVAAAFRSVDVAGVLVTAMLGGGFVDAAMAWACTRTITTIAVWAVLYVSYPDLAPRWRSVELGRIVGLLKPSLSFMMVPLANALQIQGVSLAIGAASTPAIVAIYSTLRTVTRLGVSTANTLNYSFIPQYSYAIGVGDNSRFSALKTLHARATAAWMAAYVVCVVLAGPWMTSVLSHGTIVYERATLVLLTIAAALEIVWGVFLSVGAANNTIGFLSTAFVSLSLLNLVAAGLAMRAYGLNGVAASLALSHLLMLMMALIGNSTCSTALRKCR